MLRLIHAQTIQGAILVDDIDDGLPNKNTHRLGSTGDPKAYKRDGYANEPKQSVYIPRTKPTDVAVAGYIDLNETQRVLLSAENGKIAGLQTAGLISVVSLTASDLAAPTISAAEVDLPALGDITIDGTGFLSVLPEITSVQLWGAGVGALPGITLTAAQILLGGGAVGDTQIIILTGDVPGLAAGDFVAVTADAQVSNTFVVTT